MTDQTQSPSAPAARRSRNPLGRSTWRSPPLAAWVRTRYVRRGLMTLLLLGMVGVFAWLVFRPLFHPNAQLAFLSGTDYHALQAPPVPFALEDYEAMKGRNGVSPFLARLGSQYGPLAWTNLQNPSAIGALAPKIAEAVPDGTGVMMLYVDAHGVSDDGAPYLLCRNFDPQNPSAGRFPIRDLLTELASSTASVKLLILDSGRIPCDPRLGMLVNEFPRLLKTEVERTGDRNLWVMNSNAAFQRSHISSALERSVFSFFVIRGLRGAADLNDDHRIDLDELFRYVTANTAAWVREASDGREVQTPVLYWGGGADWTNVDPPVVLPAPYDVTASVRVPTLPGASAGSSNDSPYGDEVHKELSPLAKAASKSAGKKVPGGKKLKRSIKSGKKVSKQIQGPDQHHGASKQKPAAAANGATQSGAAQTNPGKTPAAGSQSSSTTVAPSGTSNSAAASAANAKSSAAKIADEQSSQAAELLLDAWQWRDKSAATDDQPRPVDYAPQVWHEYQSWLLAEEHLDLAGGESDPEAIADRLKKLLPRLATLPRVEPLDEDQPPDLAARMAAFAPHLPAGVDNPSSLAMAQLYAERSSQPLAPDIQSAIQTIDNMIQDGTLAEMSAWLAKLDPQLDRFAEIRLARTLNTAASSVASRVDWPSVQLALHAERLGQQVVALDPALLPWIRRRVESADRLRWTGQRTLEDGIGADRRERAGSLLRQAIDQYLQAADDASVVAGAIELQNDLLDRVPYYVAWYDPVVLAASPDTPRPADLSELLEHLSALSSALDTADPARLDEIRNLMSQIAPLVDQIESGLSDITATALSTRGTAGRESRIEALLATPLPNADIRDRLLLALSDADARMAKGYQPVHVPGVVEPPPAITPDQWRQVDDRAKLELAFAKLAAGVNPTGAANAPADGEAAANDADATTTRATSAAAQLVAPLQSAYDALHNAINVSAAPSAAADSSADTETRELMEKHADAVWIAARHFGVAARDFNRALPSQIESMVEANSDLSVSATRSNRLAALRQALRAIRLVDARDVKQLGEVDPNSTIASAEMFDLLGWQEQRLEAALADAPTDDLMYLSDAAQSYRLQAEQFAHQPPLQVVPTMPLEVSGTSVISLTTEPEQVVDVQVHRTGADAAPVWLMVDYDPSMLEVDLPTKPVIYQQPQLQSEPRASGPAADEQLPLRPDRLGLAASVMLHAGDSEPFRLKIRAKPGARDATQLIVKAISADAYLRHQVRVILPPPETLELTVDGTPGTWTPAETRVQLNPFPNRKTTYRLGLTNRGVTGRMVDVQLLSAEHPPTALPPATALSADDTAAVLSRFGATAPLVALEKIAVPAGSRSVALPFPPPKKEAGGEAKPPEAAPGGEEGAAAGESPKVPPPLPPLKTPLAHGVVVVINDRQTHLSTVRWLDIAPQRPRRFVHAKVAYDFDAGRLMIRVQPQDKSLLPPGTVHVHADLIPAPPAGTQTRLDGDLTAPDYEANLYADVVPDPGRTMTVRVSVDGYPRAFVFRVPLGMESQDIPESLDLREVRILAPLSGAAFKAPIDSLPVDFEVDSPLGAFDNPDDVLEIGIDVNRQRDLRGDRTVRINTDRQVAIGLDRTEPGGLLTLESRVGDFHQFPVPVPGLRNARVDLLGRIFAAGKAGWSDAVEIVLDGSPPQIERVELRPPVVVIGPKDEEVSVWATDNELSGVSKIEAAFDPLGTGKFGGTAPAVLMDRNTSGFWTTKLPTKTLEPGDITLLVRATDQVGNESDFTKIKCHVITFDQSKALGTGEMGRLMGTVFFGPDPLPGAKLTLAGDPKVKIDPATADEHGNFTFNGVPPGKYKLSAAGLIHNKNRKTTEDVTVDPGPNPKPVKITLK